MKKTNFSVFSCAKLFALIVAGSVIVGCGNGNQTGSAIKDSIQYSQVKGQVTMSHEDSIRAMIANFDYAKHDITDAEWAEISDSDKIIVIESFSVEDKFEAVDSAELADLKKLKLKTDNDKQTLADKDKLDKSLDKTIDEVTEENKSLKQQLSQLQQPK